MPYTEAEEHWLNHQYQLYDEAFLSVPLGEATMQVSSNQRATNIKPDLLGAQILSGKSLLMGKVHYSLCSCQSTISLAVGREENKSCVFKQL